MDTILFKGIRFEDIDDKDIYSYPFETMNTEILDVYGGWYEILDEERKVIFVKGEKKDNIYKYTDEILFNKMDLIKNDDNMFYHTYPVSGPNGEKYLLLWKQPQNLINLIKDLFQFAKLEDNNLKLNKDTVNITEWLRQVIIELYTEIEGKGLNLEINIPEVKIELKIDSMKMKRVITNIINNSIKYNSKGTTIYVECRKMDNRVNIILGDNGIGIEENIKSMIFNDFVRGNHEDTDGTGLGLSISKKIIVLHDGKITLEEDEIYRTKFNISLPHTQ